jgi:FKBP-type peptidyl-prolyl cis-trans isomerase FklB
MDRMSYISGMSIGMSLKRMDVAVDPDLLVQGVTDKLGGKKLAMTDAEMKTAIDALNADIKQKQENAIAKQMAAMQGSSKTMQAAAAKNKKEGAAFLAKNKLDKGVKVLPDGLQYKIIKAGTGKKPTATDTVECNYRGTFIDGKEFDSSYKRGQPTSFPVGGVIKGWTEALKLMPVGSKWKLFVPGDLAYGPNGMPPAIGPNCTLVFEIELLSISK